MEEKARACGGRDEHRLGDAAAFEHLFQAYYEPLCAFAFRYVQSAAIAEDIVQDIFTQLWECRTTWAIQGSPRSYLCSAVRNRALMHLQPMCRPRT